MEAADKTVRLTVDQHPSLGLQISIETDGHGFRIKGPKYAGTSRRLLTAELDDRARAEIAGYIGYGDLLPALKECAEALECERSRHAMLIGHDPEDVGARNALKVADAAISKAEGQ